MEEITEEQGISFGSCQAVLTKNLYMTHVSEVNFAAADSGAKQVSPLFSLRFAPIGQNQTNISVKA